MKKALSLFLALLQAWLFVPGLFSPALAAENEVTVLVYICGSDLESDAGQATDDIAEMISSGIGSQSGATVLLATGGAGSWMEYGISSRSHQYYRVGPQGLELLRDLGQKNMGDKSTLSAFLRFGLSAAPARRYMLVFWDHGGGPVYGLCNDANYRDDYLTLEELRTGMTEGLSGQHLEIVAFDCCIMNCIDLCADLADMTDYSVLSQEMVSGTGLSYDQWMGLLARNPAADAKDVAISMAESYVEKNSKGWHADTATMAVISSAEMPRVLEAANQFSDALTALASSNLSALIRVRAGLTTFGEYVDEDATDLVDITDMCDAFSSLIPTESAALKEAAAKAVCYNCTTRDISSHAHGLSFFLPWDTVSFSARDIMNQYSGQNTAYAHLILNLTSQAAGSDYVFSASSSAPTSFFTSNESGCSGSFCDVWDGYYGDYCSFDDACSVCEGDIWAGLDTSGGSVWEGYDSSSGLWSGYDVWNGLPDGGLSSFAQDSSFQGIWDGLGGNQEQGGPSGNPWGQGGPSGNTWGQNSSGNESLTPVSSGIWVEGGSETASGSGEEGGSGSSVTGSSISQSSSATGSSSTQNSSLASQALTNIWAGLLNSGEEYYQPGEANQNLQPGVTEAATPESVLATAGVYFSTTALTSQMIYSLQLTREDLDHLATATGVLNMQRDGETIRLGDMGLTTVDWSTGMIFSMFDGGWPTLEGQMVRAEILYGDEDGNTRFVIPAMVNGLRMYLLGNRSADGTARILGATQGYDENGVAIRGSIPLETGTAVCPLFIAVDADGNEREYEGEAITVPAEGLTLTWARVPAGTYQYGFGLRDISGLTFYTETVPITF